MRGSRVLVVAGGSGTNENEDRGMLGRIPRSPQPPRPSKIIGSRVQAASEDVRAMSGERREGKRRVRV